MDLRKWAKRAVLPLLIVTAASGVVWQWSRVMAMTSALSSRADAAEKAPRAPSDLVRAEGRVAARPGALVTIGADFLGIVRAVKVGERDQVHKGDPIAEIAAEETRAQ